MLRNCHTLALALAATLALSASTAPEARAEFHSSSGTTSLVAGQVGEHEFVVNTGVVVCEVAHFTGEMFGSTSSTITLSPSYTECEFAGLFGVTVSVNGCDIILEPVFEGLGFAGGSCGFEDYVQVGSLATCRIRIAEQSARPYITYEQVGNDLEVTAEVTGIDYTESGLFCAGGSVTNGTYEGVSVVEGNGGEAELSAY